MTSNDRMPERRAITLVGGWLDGSVLDTDDTDLFVCERPSAIWLGALGCQIRNGFMGKSRGGLRGAMNAFDDAAAKARIGDAFRHKYRLTDRQMEDDVVTVAKTLA